MISFWVIFLILAITWYAYFRFTRKRMYELAALIPGYKPLPVVGDTFLFHGNTTDIMQTINTVATYSCQTEGIVKMWLGPRLYICLTNPGDVETVLNVALDKDTVYSFMKPWIGNGLVSGDVSIWKKHRKLLMPTFHQKILDNFVEVFWEQSNILVEKLKEQVGKGEFDSFSYISGCTLDIICETAMGVKVNAQNNTNSPYIQACYNGMTIVYKRMFQIWLQPDIFFRLTKYSRIQKEGVQVFHSFGDEVVKQKQQDFIDSKNNDENHTDQTTKRYAFLDLLIRQTGEGTKLNDQEMREEVDTMILAGNDTTARTISFVLLMLGCLPDVQDKVYKELEEIIGDSKSMIEIEDLPKMKYMERVIKETLRLFPVAPIFVRTLKKEVQVEKYILPKGSGCVIAAFGIHRDPKWWGDKPNDFDPDHFLPERCLNRPAHAYIPFSAGPRNCIGQKYAMMSLKTILSTILRSYRISSNVDYKTMKLQCEVLLRPVMGEANISLHHRK